MKGRFPYFLIWLATVMLSIGGIGYVLQSGLKIETSLEALMPEANTDVGFNKALHEYRSRLGKKIVFAIRGKDWTELKNTAQELIQYSERNSKIIRFQSTADFSNLDLLWKEYSQNKRALLTEGQIAAIENNQIETIEKSAMVQLFSPMSGGVSLTQDPLGLLRGFFSQLGQFSRFIPRDNFLTLEDAGIVTVLVNGELIEPWRNKNEQNRALLELESWAQEKNKLQNIKVLYTGLPFYSTHAVQKSVGEVSVYGTISILGIVLLFLLFFKSIYPLMTSLTVIGLSIFVAAVWTQVFIGSIHVFTLVIGSSVIGLIIDYLLHFHFQSFRSDIQDGQTAVMKIQGPLFWCWASTIFGFLMLLFSKLPALFQLSVFATVGITFAYFTVMAVMPLLNFKKHTMSVHLQKWNFLPQFWLARSAPQKLTAIVVLFILFTVTFFLSKPNDDVALLQERPQNLFAFEQEIRQLTGVSQDLSFVLVRAPTIETLLKAEEQIRRTFPGDNAQAISKWIPSNERQQNSLEAYEKVKPSVQKVLKMAQLPASKQTEISKSLFSSNQFDTLSFESIFAKLRGLPTSDQWLGELDDQYYSTLLIPLGNVVVTSGELGDGAEYFISQTAKDITNLFQKTRSEISMVFVIVICISFAILTFFRSAIRASFIMAPALIGSLTGLSLSGLWFGHLNLFNWLGAVLVFFVGIDYSFFLEASENQHSEITFMATFLSWMTTILSFGILAFSSTQGVASFGLTLFFGIVVSFFLAPIAKFEGAK